MMLSTWHHRTGTTSTTVPGSYIQLRMRTELLHSLIFLSRVLLPGWHMDHVEIVDDATGDNYYFPCGKWFDKKEDDGQIERILPAAKPDPNAVNCMYKVTVYTSDMKFAGTDANVFIELMGFR